MTVNTDIIEKGKWLVRAKDCGLLPVAEDGWDDTEFNSLWEKSSRKLRRRITKSINEKISVYKKRKESGEELPIDEVLNYTKLLNHSTDILDKKTTRNWKLSIIFMSCAIVIQIVTFIIRILSQKA